MAAAAAAIDRMTPSRGHFELRRESSSEANEILQGVEDGEKVQLQRSRNQAPGTSRALPLSTSPPGLPSIPSLTQRSPSGAGTVVGWGAVEKYGDSAASRGFLRELNKKRLAAFSNPSQYQKNGNSSSSFEGNGTVESNNNGGHHLTTAIKSADMEDVLRLRKVELPFIDRLTCERWYGSRGRPIRLIDAQFCAGLYEGGKDACRVSLGKGNARLVLF